MALLFGATGVVRFGDSDNVVAEVRALTPGERGADVVIEAVATPKTWEWAVEMVRKGGVVNFFGGPPSGTVVALDTNRLHYGEITLKASFHHTPATVRTAFGLLTSGRFKCREYITGTAGLGEVPEVFRRMMTRSSGGGFVVGNGVEAGRGADIKTAVFPGGNRSEQ